MPLALGTFFRPMPIWPRLSGERLDGGLSGRFVVLGKRRPRIAGRRRGIFMPSGMPLLRRVRRCVAFAAKLRLGGRRSIM